MTNTWVVNWSILQGCSRASFLVSEHIQFIHKVDETRGVWMPTLQNPSRSTMAYLELARLFLPTHDTQRIWYQYLLSTIRLDPAPGNFWKLLLPFPKVWSFVSMTAREHKLEASRSCSPQAASPADATVSSILRWSASWVYAHQRRWPWTGHFDHTFDLVEHWTGNK